MRKNHEMINTDYTYPNTEGFDLSADRVVECSVQWATVPVSLK